MNKIAIISDIHANLPALQAVLKDIAKFEADEIYCLGDLIDGAPWHNEVIELIRSLKIPVIMGNHDERIALDMPVLFLSKHSLEEQEARLLAINFSKATTKDEHKQYLAGLPESLRLTFGDIRILLAHGSPDSNDEYLYENFDENKLREALDKRQANLLIIGHTHQSYIREIQGNDGSDPMVVINAGSVGRTKEGDGKACYLQLNIASDSSGKYSVIPAIRKVEYDIMETVKGIRSSPVPDFYADFLLTNRS